MPLADDGASGIFLLSQVPTDVTELFSSVAAAIGIIGVAPENLGWHVEDSQDGPRLFIPGGWAWSDEVVQAAIAAFEK